MSLCVVAALLAVCIWIWMARRESYRTFCYIPQLVLAAAILGLLAGAMEQRDSSYLGDGKVMKAQPGEGDRTVEFTLGIESETEDTELPYEVLVAERRLSKTELEKVFTEAKKELDTAFLNGNDSLDHITENVVMRQSLADGLVEAVWQLDNYDVVSSEGKIDEAYVEKRGTLISAEVELTCQEIVQMYSFTFCVYPRDKTVTEQVLDQLKQQVTNEETTHGEDEVLELPDSVADYQLSWKPKATSTSYSLLMLGIVAAIAVAIAKRTDQMRQQEERQRRLLRDYPDIVSQLALLTGAGMTGRAAVEKMVTAYRKSVDKVGKRRDAYEELCITYRELQDGVGEQRAYEHWAARCGVQEYRRLISLLTQNLNKGSSGLAQLLEQEVAWAYTNRRNLAKQYGEEASTKLMLPMLLMLGVVLAILMIPAAMSIQI